MRSLWNTVAFFAAIALGCALSGVVEAQEQEEFIETPPAPIVFAEVGEEVTLGPVVVAEDFAEGAAFEWLFDDEEVGEEAELVIEEVAEEDFGIYTVVVSHDDFEDEVFEVELSEPRIVLTPPESEVREWLGEEVTLGPVEVVEAIEEDVSFEWFFEGEPVGTEASFTIPALTDEDTGVYTLVVDHPDLEEAEFEVEVSAIQLIERYPLPLILVEEGQEDVLLGPIDVPDDFEGGMSFEWTFEDEVVSTDSYISFPEITRDVVGTYTVEVDHPAFAEREEYETPEIIEIEFVIPEPLRNFRATTGDMTSDVMLTWDNPIGIDVEEISIYRQTGAFPEEPGDGEEVFVGEGDEEQYRDTGTQEGQEYFYALFAELNIEGIPFFEFAEDSFYLTDTLYARGVPGVDSAGYVTDVFSPERPVNLGYSQITIEPTVSLSDALASGQPEFYMNPSDYEISFESDVHELPFARDPGIGVHINDDKFAFLHPQEEPAVGDGRPGRPRRGRVGRIEELELPDIPFFGQMFNDFVLGANGYVTTGESLYTLETIDTAEAIYAADETYDEDISFQVEPLYELDSSFELGRGIRRDSPDNFPSLETHFNVPRISFSFADLSTTAAGEMWAKQLDDRVVLTFDKIPEQGQGFAPKPNTAQLELFFDGTIRYTYRDLNADDMVIGISDGRGVPGFFEADGTFQRVDAETGTGLTEFRVLPPPPPISISRVAPQIIEAGDTVQFDISAAAEEGGAPSLEASALPPGAEFTVSGSSGAFVWETVPGDAGVYDVTFCAETEEHQTCQTVVILVYDDDTRPVAGNVRLEPGQITAGQPIEAKYEFLDPSGTSEVNSRFYWYRNGAFVSALEGHSSVPGEMVQEGDRWYFAVVPRNAIGITGRPVFSKTGTTDRAPGEDEDRFALDVNDDGQVDSLDIQIIINDLLGLEIDPTYNTDVNGDGVTDAVDLQFVINHVLGLPLPGN
ncbi:MAG: dockerin type I domain-containing protein [Candidatus Hydrogenedentota bacterium]